MDVFDIADEWIIDTGSYFDVVNSANARGYKNLQFVARKLRFSTAGGETSASTYIKLSNQDFGNMYKPQTTETVVLKSTPNILSVGRRVESNGFSFIWLTGYRPCLVRPGNDIIMLDTDRGLPVLNRSCRHWTIDKQLIIDECGVTLDRRGNPKIKLFSPARRTVAGAPCPSEPNEKWN